MAMFSFQRAKIVYKILKNEEKYKKNAFWPEKLIIVNGFISFSDRFIAKKSSRHKVNVSGAFTYNGVATMESQSHGLLLQNHLLAIADNETLAMTYLPTTQVVELAVNTETFYSSIVDALATLLSDGDNQLGTCLD